MDVNIGTTSDLDEMVKTIKADVNVPEEPLDPNPKTSAGQQRHLYYGAEEANLSVRSQDFDDIYEHDRTDELTFGSRPPTAPEKVDKPDPKSPFTPGTDLADNSMVLIGQTTADRKNTLIGNQFQNPKQNQQPEELKDELEMLQKQNEEILNLIAK